MRRIALLALAWLLLSASGAAWMGRAELDRQRAAFETDARIAHRLLSQRVVEHDAILATLVLLQPGAVAGEAAPEQRLPSVYPQVLGVLRHDGTTDWPADRQQALTAGETASRAAGRAVLAHADFTAGHYTVVRAAHPASFALVIDLKALVPRAEWPLPDNGPVRVALQHAGQERVLMPGQVASPGGWSFGFRKHLAAESQAFDVVAERRIGWDELPWGRIAGWAVACGLAVLGIRAWAHQRAGRRRAQELLRLGRVGRLNAMGELAAGMAHELNQPLTAVLANTNAAQRLLAEAPPDLETAREAMAQAATQARRAADVIGRLRRSVQEPGDTTVRVPVAWADTVRRALDVLAPELQRLGVSAEISGDAATRVVADPVALEQVLHNLLNNALHALEQVPAAERRLMLSLGTDSTQGVLRVRDTGPGIAPDALPRLFEPFFSTRHGGLGLGLSLCETLATRMGGTLSGGNAEQRGAEFWLALPLATTPAR